MDFQIYNRAHLTHGGQAALMTECQELAEEADKGPWGCRAVSFLAPSALEAFSQLPMTAGGL